MTPLREPVFQRIWLGSLLSNFGLMIGGVGAAWAMTQLTAAADMVALVQTAVMAPMMLAALGSGAMADMYDRRLLALGGLTISLLSSAILAATAYLDLITPNILLGLSFSIGLGMALFSPSWQASVSEQVSADALPSAIALNSISYNIARSFGPAIGGVIVAAAGAVAAFAANALLYIPLLLVLFAWRRAHEVARLPPERLGAAVVSGMRYVLHSPRIRVVLGRTLLMGLIGASVSALMPLVARDLLHGDAQTYGIMLGAFGVGAVLGAFGSTSLRRHLSSEAAVRLCAVVMGAATVVVGLSRSPFLTAPALVAAGAAWMVAGTQFNVAVQLSAPRWVAGRALSTYQMAITGGIAIGSWGWGHVAQALGVNVALVISGAAMAASLALGFWLRMPVVEGTPEPADLLEEPEVNLGLTLRSGPIVVELDYRVAAEDARAFYGLMQEVQQSRQRNGAYGWSIARDIAEPELWTERFHCPTWLDYLRQRNRRTQAERALQDRARQFHLGDDPVQIRRMLERPFGSVRWKEEAPDSAYAGVLPPSS